MCVQALLLPHGTDAGLGLQGAGHLRTFPLIAELRTQQKRQTQLASARTRPQQARGAHGRWWNRWRFGEDLPEKALPELLQGEGEKPATKWQPRQGQRSCSHEWSGKTQVREGHPILTAGPRSQGTGREK